MIKSNSLKITCMLVFFLGAMVFAQDKQVNADKDKQLREEILTVYKAQEEKGLRDFVNKQKDKIPNKFIVDFAELGVKERKEEWLKICEIMAEEKKDEKTLADIYYKIGVYFRLISNNKKAVDYLEKAFHTYIKIDDTVGQGNVYLSKGIIFSNIGDNSRALEMYDKALPFFDKVGKAISQGNVYMSKGDIYLYTGDHSRALEMYDKALFFFGKGNSSIGKADVYLRKGNIYFHKGDNSKALGMYDKALPFFKKSGEINRQGDVYLSKGDIFFYTGNYSSAFEMYDKALPFFDKAKNANGKGYVHLSKGRVYFYIGKNSMALEMYDKALPFFEKSEDIIGQGNVYKNIGNIYLRIGDNSKALKMYDKALPFFKKAEDPFGQRNIYHRKGNIYSNTGDNLKALGMYEKALSYFKNSEDPRGQGVIYMGMGDIYTKIGENSSAIEIYEKALFLFKKANAPRGQGSVYLREGNIYLSIANYSKAIKMFDKALPFFEKTGEPIGQGNIFQSKGNIYFYTGNNSRALNMYDKALPFFEKAGEAIGQGNIYLLKGDIFHTLGDYSRALEMYEKALFFFEKMDEPIGQGNVHWKKGDIYFFIGDNSRAFKMYNIALSFFEKAGDPVGQSNVHRKKGDIYFTLGGYSKALEMYDKAFKFLVKTGNIGGLFNALFGKAKALGKMNKKKKALEFFKKAISNLEKIRMQTAFLEMKRTFLERVYNQYEETVLFMLENKYYDKGFKYAESMRARVFLDQMAEGLVGLGKGLEPELKEERDRLLGKLSALTRQMQETGSKNEKKLQELKEEYHRVESQFEDLLIKIRLENPLYASVRYPQPVSLRELQKKVLRKGEILLRYFISTDKVYVFLVSKKRFKVVPLEVKEEQLRSYANRLLLAMKENSKGDMERCGKLLYRGLFKPIESKLKGKRDIIIIPDRYLARIPFESFITGEAKSGRPIFLLEKYRLKYMQSASILSILRKHYRRDRETKSFIAFGDPVYDYENFKQGQPEKGSMKTFATESIFSREDTRSDTKEKSLSSVPPVSSVAVEDEIKEIFRSRYARAGGLMNRLQGSGEEVRTIARLFESKSQKSIIHLREQATEDNAKAANLKEFDYIHFACHGILSETFQSLVLSQIPEAKEDGYFTLNEIMNCDYNAKLVILSGCQTGSGKMERAEGVTGLTRAVMYAGTPAVIASLWDVHDPAAKELMVTFYRNMLEKNLDKTEALRQAKLELIKGKKYVSPLFWSAFVMYGE